jgi:hypothetical protein
MTCCTTGAAQKSWPALLMGSQDLDLACKAHKIMLKVEKAAQRCAGKLRKLRQEANYQGIILIESTQIRRFSRRSGREDWSFLLEAKSLKTNSKKIIRLESTQVR